MTFKISLNVSEETLAKMDRLSQSKDITRTSVIRRGVEVLDLIDQMQHEDSVLCVKDKEGNMTMLHVVI